MSANLDTHLFQSMSSLAQEMANATMAARKPLLEEIEHLRERLGAVTLLMALAGEAVDIGLLPEARKYIQLAEKSARGEKDNGPQATD